jgi:ABC-type glycerol-3-phosphate transport system permease component
MAQAVKTTTVARPVHRQSFLASKRGQELTLKTFATILCIVGALVIMFPIFWMISTSLKTQAEVAKFPIVWIPNVFQWQNYPTALTVNPFGAYFVNTMYYALGSTIFELISCAFIAYGFARLRAPGKNFLFMLVLGTMMMPTWVTLIPQYIMFSKIGWVGTYNPLLIPKLFGSSYLIFMLRQFYRTLPKDYEEAAIIDGANYFGIWWRIMLPLSLPALGAVAIMSFMYHYQDFAGPLIYINDTLKYPVSLGLQQFRAPFGGTAFHLLMAASVVFLVPPIVLFFLCQRYFIQGIVVSGVKG